MRLAPAAGLPAGGSGEVETQAQCVNETLRRLDVRLRFEVDKRSEDVRILVVDGGTGEVIRKVPPDYFLKAASAAADTSVARGLIMDENA